MPAEIRDELWRRFIKALAPLRTAGKLGLAHFQFPAWSVCNAAGHARAQHCVERMACHLVRVEFRHQSWFGGERTVSTLAFEFELGEVHTVVDGPRGFSNSVPAIWEGSHPRFALLRLHGRNTSTWNVKGASAAFDRFNYHCSDPEPDEVARQLAQLATKASTMHVVFNNNIEDQGQRNAASLQVRLASLGPA